MDAINLLVPALAGVVGVLLGTFLAGRNQRNQVLAERMIAAADDLATTAGAALDTFFTALSRPELAREQMELAEKLIPQAMTRVSRVVLLFHPDSESTTAARVSVGQLSGLRYDMSLYLNTDDDARDALAFHGMWARCNEAHDALEEFLRESAHAIRNPGRRRFGPRRDPAVVIESKSASETVRGTASRSRSA